MRRVSVFLPVLAFAASCAASSGTSPVATSAGGDAGVAGSGGAAGSGIAIGGGSSGTAGQGGAAIMLSAGAPVGSNDPQSCDDAAASKSYIGCDYWPTPVSNIVWSNFDFTVVVANAGQDPVNISVTQGGAVVASTTVAAGALAKLYLPWIPQLKGPDFDDCGNWSPLTETLGVLGAAYHLVSDKPVTVYQFNPLEYQGKGGPDGKDWTTCPGLTMCNDGGKSQGVVFGCYSFSNDASLLLPSTAMTGNYRVFSYPATNQGTIPGYAAITGTADGTQVTVRLGPKGSIRAGAGLSALGPGQIFTFTLDAGDVIELVAGTDGDLSGSQISATQPVQVITGTQCIEIPDGKASCDHLEETIFPAETLGKHYFAAQPTAPGGQVLGQEVRIYGNVDGTVLTYPGTTPPNAPATIDAGQTVDLGIIDVDFEVSGDHEFAVGIFQLGGSVVDPTSGNHRGDPSESFATAVEQYRPQYVFLAPDDYDESWVDVTMPTGTMLTLDGTAVTQTPTDVSSGYQVVRVPLPSGQGGAHSLVATASVGIQVIGYGSATSYQYPGGLNLLSIAPPPPPIK